MSARESKYPREQEQSPKRYYQTGKREHKIRKEHTRHESVSDLIAVVVVVR